MEVLEMIAHIAIAIAVIFSGIALFISNRTNKLQRESLQANMFNNITERLNELISKMPSEDNKKDSLHWHIMFLNAFEHFCFFTNRKYLNPDMESYYKGYILAFCENINKDCPGAIDYLEKNKKDSEIYSGSKATTTATAPPITAK